MFTKKAYSRSEDSWLMLSQSYRSNSSNCKKTSSGTSAAHQQALHVPNRIKFLRSSGAAHTVHERLGFVCSQQSLVLLWHVALISIKRLSIDVSPSRNAILNVRPKCIAQERSQITQSSYFPAACEGRHWQWRMGHWKPHKKLCISVFRQKYELNR